MTPPPPPPSSRGLELATDTLLTASRAMVGISLRSLAASPVAVTLPQHRLLVLLAAGGGRTIGDLGAHLGVNQSSASRLVDRLARLGLAHREPSSADRRSVLVVLTPAGRAVLDAVTASRRREIADLLADLTPVERRAAVRGMSAFNRVAEEPGDADWATPTPGRTDRPGRTSHET